MVNRTHINIVLLALLFATGWLSLTTAHAQENVPGKAETKLYNKTVAKPSVKALNKFLKSYPESKYAGEMTKLRDSLIFFTEIDRNDAIRVEEFAMQHPKSAYTASAYALLDSLDIPQTDATQAEEVVGSLMGSYDTESAEILVYRNHNRDFIAVFRLMAPDLPFGSLRVSTYGKTDSGWEMVGETVHGKYISSEKMNRSIPAKAATTLRIGGKKMILHSYLNFTAGDTRNMEYVAELTGLDGNEICNTMFYGVNMTNTIPYKGAGFAIEGRSPETMAQGGLSREQAYLMEHISTDQSLKKINEADALTDDAIEWWLNRNPKAMTSATSLSFGSLPEESSLVAAFKKARKENSKTFQAAVIDFRGYTMVVSYGKSSKKYSLVWVEPECRNKKTDRYLADIYFESNGSTLDLFYYKGKTSFKYHISLLAKTIRR